MTDREMVLELVAKLPEDVTIREIIEEIQFLAGLDAALEGVKAGRVMSENDLRHQMRQWLSSGSEGNLAFRVDKPR
ncbi:hypothetical protein TSACC_22722 [Terrimicrobium sacchariphilum]|uniref:Uncharacterized protein n=1 Tax=Terrimicrobium sacchariphilum TaxID=690879 RepID=A0A146GC69_TERSA|nr:hypothetical protein [Terrimicrobium sacchariphilum]GAT34297.1 hypothetical protein TSACC_22722 [Terrimicrobium sacchariphilum]